jgi:hypothetical protein
MHRSRQWQVFAQLALAFGLGFVSYQGILMLASLILGGEETFAPPVVAQIAVINAAWLAGLIVLNELLSLVAKRFIGRMPRLLKA